MLSYNNGFNSTRVFIKLTKGNLHVTPEEQNRLNVCVAVDCIVALVEVFDKSGVTEVVLANSTEGFYVQESPEKIIDLCKQALKLAYK